MKHIPAPSGAPKPPSSPSLTASVAIQIRAAILDGTYPPGTRLRPDELRRTYDVSLSPLREALTRLAAEDLIQITDRRGYQVTPMSAENLREVTVLRTQLEITALKESLRRGDDAWED